MSLEIFSGTNLAPAGGLADRRRRETSKATSQPGFVLILPTFSETRLCLSQPCPITTLSWMSAPPQSPFPCSSGLGNQDIFGGGPWARGRPGTGSMNKEKTQRKSWKGTTKGEKIPKKSYSCPDTLLIKCSPFAHREEQIPFLPFFLWKMRHMEGSIVEGSRLS